MEGCTASTMAVYPSLQAMRITLKSYLQVTW